MTEPTNSFSPGSFLGSSNTQPVIFKMTNIHSGLINTTSSSFGYNSMSVITPISYNTAFGTNTLKSTSIIYTTNGYNTAVGHNALTNLKEGAGNTAIGCQALESLNNTVYQNAQLNTVVGYRSMKSLTSGSGNTSLGTYSLGLLTSGSNNTSLGYWSMNSMTQGGNNVVIGNQALYTNTNSSDNVIIGALSYLNSTFGTSNIGIGFSSGNGNITGSKNIAIGSNSTSTSAGNGNILIGNSINTLFSPNTLTHRILNIGNVIFGYNMNRVNSEDDFLAATGKIGINKSTPANTLEINSDFINSALTSSGLRFTNLKNTIIPVTNPSLLADKGVLSVDLNGDVILVKDIGGGINQNCSTQGFVPINSSTVGILGCSQLYDNNTTSVGIGYPTATAANAVFPTVPGAWFSTSGTVYSSYSNYRLAVNGITRADGYLATSDRKFKKDIKPIQNALKTIDAIGGKTYLWDIESNKEMNFDNGGHSGFIAQELEKVLPHLVATGQNWDKAVNYMELLPYVVEAIKELQNLIQDQQMQIEELKNQISDNFKVQHQDLIALENTKIINVSPNPSKDMITISLNIEKSVQNAVLQVHDLNGKTMNSLIINERNTNIKKTFLKDNFGEGVYIVSLVVNGKSIDSKKIIFN